MDDLSGVAGLPGVTGTQLLKVLKELKSSECDKRYADALKNSMKELRKKVEAANATANAKGNT